MSGSTPSPAQSPVAVFRIVLTGFMGAGKSTVGALLAQRLGWQFLDSDHLVEASAGATIAEIFERDGESSFREREAAAIREAALQERIVLAVGGGAIERPDTRDFLLSLPACRVVFLEAPLEILLSRCEEHVAGPVRPLLADRARLAQRWAARLPLYRQAHLTLPTAGRPPHAVADAILAALIPESASSPRAGSPHPTPGVLA